MNVTPILESLERAAQCCADPAPLIYRRLFELHPDFESLFVMDRDGGVRGSMLQTCFDILIGMTDGSETSRFLVSAGRAHHTGYGVPEHQFDAMFVAIRDTICGLLGPDWTQDTEAAWESLLAQIAVIE